MTVPLPVQAGSLARVAKGWRLVLTGLGISALLYGSVAGDDDLFPFGPLSQYAGPFRLDSEVVSTYAEATTVDGERIELPLTSREVGVGRSDVEGQLPAIIGNPALLQSLAEARAQLQPEKPKLARIHLMQETTQLRHGRPVGQPHKRELVTWTVRP
ncbi:hypothetical protein [Flindersiella endophytica]